MSKEDLEKQIKQNLMQKDKEVIIDLYLQMKYERDISEQQTENLKAKNKELRKECFWEFGKFKASYKELHQDAIQYNKKLWQQLKEKGEEIARYAELFGMKDKDFYVVEKTEYEKMRSGAKEIIKQAKNDNTKLLCEKIRKFSIERRIELRNRFSEYGKGKENAYYEVCEFLKQIESGGEE